MAAGCGPQNAVVGAFPGWSTQFVAEEGLWEQTTPLPGATIAFGAPNGAAGDNAVVELRLPGLPGAGPDTDSGPDVATQIATRRFMQFGTFRARVSFASCAPTEEVASAVFAFFNDGSDVNGNGIVDNPEIDFQVLCGTPTFIVLTCWSDFEQATATTPERFIKQSHAVDMSTGDGYDTVSESDNAFAKTTTGGDLVDPGFPAANGFYEVGFDWEPIARAFLHREPGPRDDALDPRRFQGHPAGPLAVHLQPVASDRALAPRPLSRGLSSDGRGAARRLGRVLDAVAGEAPGVEPGAGQLQGRRRSPRGAAQRPSGRTNVNLAPPAEDSSPDLPAVGLDDSLGDVEAEA